MKLFTRLKQFTQMVFARSSSLWSWIVPRTKINFKREVGDLDGSSLVMATVLWIARNFPEAPVMLEKDDEPIYEHGMLELLKRPNAFYSGYLIWMATLISYCLDGNAYWIKIRNRQLKPVELWYVPHWIMDPASPDNGSEFISHYEYRPDGKTIKLSTDDVIHFRYGLDPKNPRKGLAPLASAIREIFTDEEASNFSAAILRNAGIPGVIISPDSDVPANQKDVDDVKKYFKDRFTGDRRGEPFVMSGKTNVQSFGFSPQEMDLSQIRRIPEERITALLGIPAAVVGFGTGLSQTKVGATMKELREMAYENGIIPLQRFFAEELHTQLLQDFEPKPKILKVTFDLSNVRVLQEDQNQLVQRTNVMVQGGWITIGEGRNQVGFETDSSHDIYLRQISQIEVPAGSKPRPVTIPEKRMKSVSAWAGRLSNELYRSERRMIFRFEEELVKAFADFGKEVAGVYLDLHERGLVRAADKPEVKDIEGEIEAQLIMDTLTETGILANPIPWKNHYLRVAHEAVDIVNAVIGIGAGLTDKEELAILEKGGRHIGLIDLSGQTKDAVFHTLEAAKEEGLGPRQIAQQLKGQVARGPWSDSEIRSNVIARTETKYAQNVSTLEAYKATDTIEAIQVLDSQLGSFDDWCDAVNGRIVTFADADYLAGEEHPNGTRTFIPVVRTGDEEIVIDGLPSGVQPNT